VSNLRTRTYESLDSHSLPAMLAAGVLCSISTDDPAMFDTDLTREYETAATLGCDAETAFRAGVRGALCDEQTRSALGERWRRREGGKLEVGDESE
jgi:aminodeoxyfutalosine deaminase